MHLALHRRHTDPLSASCADNINRLADVWSSTVALHTTDTGVVAVQREVARWARETNHVLAEKFGYGETSDEVRVILRSIADAVPRLPRDGRLFVELVTIEARDLTRRANAALGAALMAPLHPRVPPYGS